MLKCPHDSPNLTRPANHPLSAATAECLASYNAGHFYAAISLSQTLADAITRFLLLQNDLPGAKDLSARIRRLRQARALSPKSIDALTRIWQSRDSFAHLALSPRLDPGQLEEVATANLADLLALESELFCGECRGSLPFRACLRLRRGGLVSPDRPSRWP